MKLLEPLKTNVEIEFRKQWTNQGLQGMYREGIQGGAISIV